MTTLRSPSHHLHVAHWQRVVISLLILLPLLLPWGASEAPAAPSSGIEDQQAWQISTTLPAGTVVEVIDPQLYLRSAPGFASQVLAKMALGTRGTVLAGPTWSGGTPWYQIQTSAYSIGWASGNYLKVISVPAQPTPTPTPSGTSGFAPGSTIEIANPDLYLRSAAGFNSVVLARMKLGTRGTVLAGPVQSDGHPWYKIQTAAYGTGWASGKYLKLVSGGTVQPTPIPTPVPVGGIPIGSIVENTVGSLNLRKSPSLTGTIIAYLPYLTRSTVLAGPTWAGNVPWYQLSTPYGTGWASGYYLRIASSSGAATMPTDGMSRLISRGTSGRKEIALTFDAGSDRGYAKQILDVLEANGIKASFGITGVWAQKNPDLIQRMVSEGHMIINHTWSHPSFTGFSAQPALTSSTARTAELTKTADYIYTLTAYRTAPYWRPPYGDINTSVRIDAYNAGYWQTVMWSVDSMGWNGASVSQILTRCAYNAKAGDILLMHVGGDSNDYFALQQMIDILRSNGFTFVTVSQIIS